MVFRAFTIHLYARRLVLGVSPFDANVSRTATLADVKAAVFEQFSLRRRLTEWYRRENAWVSVQDDQELLQRLYDDLSSGRIRAREEREPRVFSATRTSPKPPPALPSDERRHAPLPSPFSTPEKSLQITTCQPVVRRDGVLKYTYVVRGLEGRPVILQLRSKAYPGGLLHQRPLEPDETGDGPHDAEWSGEISEGPHAGERVHPRHGDCTLELVHDEVYHDEATFRVACVRSRTIDFEDLLFNTDSAVLMPDYWDCVGDPFHPDADSNTGLRALAVCLREQSLFPEQTILIAGHTDRKGSEQHNLELSQLRGENVAHALRGDADAWAANAAERHTTRDWQQILAWVHRSFGWDCDPGSVDGVAGWRSKRAVRRFAKNWTETGDWSLAESDAPTIDHWRAFFALFDFKLADILELADVSELEDKRAALRFVDDDRKAVGCGELRPRVATADGVRESANRRVEIMFFDPGEEPRLDCHATPGQCAVEQCELVNSDVYEIEYIPCLIRKPVEVFFVAGELGARIGTAGKALGKHFVVGTFGQPREDEYPWRVRIAAGRPPIPLKLLYRRHNEERELCWRDVCPELYFGSGGWLEPELYVVDGPESEPTANREGSRIRISGVQQGDAIIAEEQSTPGKLKGRAEVYVVKNFTWSDLQRTGGTLKFWGPLQQLPQELREGIQSALSYMLDTRPGRAQEKDRLAIVEKVYKSSYDQKTGTGDGKLYGQNMETDHDVFGFCLAPIPSAGGVGCFPRDTYHFHVGMLFPHPDLTYEEVGDAANDYEDRRVKIEVSLSEALADAKVGPTTGLLGLEDIVVWSQCSYVQQLLDPLIVMMGRCWPVRGARLHFHSYEQGIKKYISPADPHHLHPIDPLRNVEVILDRRGGPTLRVPGERQFKLDNGEEFRVEGYAEIRELDLFVTSCGEIFLYHAEAMAIRGLDAVWLTNGWLMLADALGEF